MAASRHDKDTQHGTTDVLDLAEKAEEEDLSLPTTSLFKGALEESRTIATRVNPKEDTLCFLENEKDNLSQVTYAAAAVNSTLPTYPVPKQGSLTAPPSTTASSSTATTTPSASSSTATATWAPSSATASPSRASANATAYDRRVTKIS